MKKLISITFVILMTNVFAMAQPKTFTIANPNMDVQSVVKKNTLVEMNAGITNNTRQKVVIVFKQISAEYPNGWIHSFCGPLSCFTPGSSFSGKDTLSADNSKLGYFKVSMSFKTAGVGVVVYEAYDEKFPEDKIRVTYRLTAEMPQGIEENLAAMTKIYPNPASGSVNVTLPNASFTEIVVSDITGRSLSSQPAQLSQTVDISGLDAGMYFITVKGANTFRKSFMVQ